MCTKEEENADKQVREKRAVVKVYCIHLLSVRGIFQHIIVSGIFAFFDFSDLLADAERLND